MRRLVTSGGCVVGEGLGFWLRNMKFTMSTYAFEPLGGVVIGINAPDCFYIHSSVVLE
jgi:hypothetical protein